MDIEIIELAKELLSYSSETGDFIWLRDRGRRAKKDSIAGRVDSSGYKQITIKGKSYLAHRLAFVFMGEGWPKDCVDHINRNRLDNRWCNLREATKRQNANNKIMNDSAGATKIGNRYQASIKRRVNGVQTMKHLGMFGTKEEAHLAYVVAKNEYVKELN